MSFKNKNAKEKFYKKLLHRALVALGISGILNVFLIGYLISEFDETGYFFSGDFQTVGMQEEKPILAAAYVEPKFEEVPVMEKVAVPVDELPKQVLPPPIAQNIPTLKKTLPEVPKKVLSQTKSILQQNKKLEQSKKPEIAKNPAKQMAQVVHVVRAGESLWVIARRYRLDVSVIKKYNNLSTDALQPGMELKIPITQAR